MKKNKGNVLLNKIKNKRFVALALTATLASGVAAATAAAVATADGNRIGNVARVSDNGSKSANGVNLLAESGSATNILVRESASLTKDQIFKIGEKLNAVQELINNLGPLSLSVTESGLRAFLTPAFTSLYNAPVDFATNLGLNGDDATTFFEDVENILPSSAEYLGLPLRKQIGFLYTRTGLRADGLSYASVRVVFNYSKPDFIEPKTQATLIKILVTGINSALGSENSDPQKSLWRREVASEVERINKLRLRGSLRHSVPAANNAIVTDLSEFGIDNARLNSNKFVYEVSHESLNVNGSFWLILRVLAKNDWNIISEEIIIPIIVAITTSDFSESDGRSGAKFWPIAGPLIGAAGLGGLGLAAFIFSKRLFPCLRAGSIDTARINDIELEILSPRHEAQSALPELKQRLVVSSTSEAGVIDQGATGVGTDSSGEPGLRTTGGTWREYRPDTPTGTLGMHEQDVVAKIAADEEQILSNAYRDIQPRVVGGQAVSVQLGAELGAESSAEPIARAIDGGRDVLGAGSQLFAEPVPSIRGQLIGDRVPLIGAQVSGPLSDAAVDTALGASNAELAAGLVGEPMPFDPAQAASILERLSGEAIGELYVAEGGAVAAAAGGRALAALSAGAVIPGARAEAFALAAQGAAEAGEMFLAETGAEMSEQILIDAWFALAHL